MIESRLFNPNDYAPEYEEPVRAQGDEFLNPFRVWTAIQLLKEETTLATADSLTTSEVAVEELWGDEVLMEAERIIAEDSNEKEQVQFFDDGPTTGKLERS